MKESISTSKLKPAVAKSLSLSVTISPERVREIIELNKQGVKPERIQGSDFEVKVERSAYGDLVGQDSISRFDNTKKKKKKKPRAKEILAPKGNNNNKEKRQGAKEQEKRQGVKEQPKKGPNFQDRQRKGRDNRRQFGPPSSQPTGLREFRPRNPDKRPKHNPSGRERSSKNDNGES